MEYLSIHGDIFVIYGILSKKIQCFTAPQLWGEDHKQDQNFMQPGSLSATNIYT